MRPDVSKSTGRWDISYGSVLSQYAILTVRSCVLLLAGRYNRWTLTLRHYDCSCSWISMSLTSSFAFMAPLTPSANDVLRLPHNKPYLVDAEACGDVPTLSGVRRPVITKLDFAMLLGRSCVAFGSSRAAEIRFPATAGISTVHFILHFDLRTAKLLLTDTSDSGTFIWDNTCSRPQLLRRSTHQLTSCTIVQLGPDPKLRFCFKVEENINLQLLERYGRSIEDHIPTEVAEVSLPSRTTKPISKRRCSADFEAPAEVKRRKKMDVCRPESLLTNAIMLRSF